MNICCERYFKLSRDEYLKIKKFIDNNIDIIESTLVPTNDHFDLYKKFYNRYYYSCYYYHKKSVRHIFSNNRHQGFHEKIIKSYFNISYIKYLCLLQKEIKLNKNISNINVIINIFINLYDNSNIDFNKKIEINYMICIIILFIVINVRTIFSLVIINRSFYY